jgi:hypothetical protein
VTNALQEVSQAERAIELAKTPQDANEIRARLKAIQKYLAKRGGEFAKAFEAAKLECEAAAKAGELWAEERPGHGPGRGKTQTFASFSDAGFANSQDASICVRLGELDPQDVAIYFDEMEGKKRYPTEGGLHILWKLMNAEEDEGKPWLRVYNLWNFAKPDERFGQGHPGNIPGQVNMNLNYYLTEPGELIVDLFAGGGTTLDVCAEDNDDYGNRKCLSFDRKPVRKEIKKWDLTDGLPEFPDAAMVFLDPPYWGQKAGEYSADDADLANMPLEKFNKALAAVVDASLKRARCVALIIGATQKEGQFYDHAAWLMGAFGAPRHRFQVPYSTEQYKAFDVVRAKKNKAYLNVCRDLMVWAQ